MPVQQCQLNYPNTGMNYLHPNILNLANSSLHWGCDDFNDGFQFAERFVDVERNSIKGRLLNDWAQVLAWNFIRCVIIEEWAGKIIVWLLHASPGIPVGEMTRGTAEPGVSFSRAPSIAAMPELATPKSSAMVEALAVIIGIKNRRMWQSLPPPLVLGLGNSGGVLRTMEEEDAAVATMAVSGSCGDNGGERRRRRRHDVDEEKQWPRASCED